MLVVHLILALVTLAACTPESDVETGGAEPTQTPTENRVPTKPPTPVQVPTSTPTPVPPTIPVDSLTVNENPGFRPGWFDINIMPFDLPGTEEVEVVNYTYAHIGEKPLRMDLYYPPGTPEDSQLPTVIFGIGYRMSAMTLRNEHFYISWGRLVAAAGMVAVIYDTEQPDSDLVLLLDTLRENALQLRIDPENLGIMASSANTPTVMSVTMQEKVEGLRFAVYYYGLSMTPDKAYWDVLRANCTYRGCLYADLAPVSYVDPEVPLLVVEVGQDFIKQGNEAMDHFIEYVRSEGGTVTLIEYEDGVHGFDTEQQTQESADVIKQTVEFMLASFELEQ
jgi:hypothetical protein